MSYKTVVVHVDRSGHAANRIEAAAELARAEDGYLVRVMVSGDAAHSRESAELDTFERIARQVGVNAYETRVVEDDVK